MVEIRPRTALIGRNEQSCLLPSIRAQAWEGNSEKDHDLGNLPFLNARSADAKAEDRNILSHPDRGAKSRGGDGLWVPGLDRRVRKVVQTGHRTISRHRGRL